MKNIHYKTIGFLAMIILALNIGRAQSVNFELIFNNTTCLYEARMHVLETIPSPGQNLGTAGFTIVVPAGTNNDNPIGTNAVQPPGSTWQDNSPGLSPDLMNAYHKFATSGGTFSASLAAGEIVTLFTFSLENEDCLEGVRVLNNNVIKGVPVGGGDPQPDGIDFDNSLQVLAHGEVYDGNTNNDGIVLPSPTLSPSSNCNASEINLMANPPVDFPACLSPSFSWEGPSGFTSNLENPTVTLTDPAAQSGDYTVTVTDLNGCSDVKTINVDAVSCGSLVPVELRSFSVLKRNEIAALNWQTVTEQNNMLFEIERSTNGTDFESIGKVKGAGNSTELQDYSFNDRSPSNAINFYRLKQIDYDGNFTYSDIKSLDFTDKGTINVFPNPTNSYFTIEGEKRGQAGFQYQLINELGQVVKSANIGNGEKVTTDDLNYGVYFLKIMNENQVEFHTTKLYIIR